MNDHQEPARRPGPARFLCPLIQTVHLAMGATLAFVLGRAVLSPAFAKRETLWLHAGDLEGSPTASRCRSRCASRGPTAPAKWSIAASSISSRPATRGARARFDVHAPGLPHQVQPRDQAHRVPVSWRRLRHRRDRSWPVRRRRRSRRCPRASTAIRSWSRCRRQCCSAARSTGSTRAPATARCCATRSTNRCRRAPAGSSPPAASSRCCRHASSRPASC